MAVLVVLTLASCGRHGLGGRAGAFAYEDSGASCVEHYDLDTLLNRAFAFDGSIAAVEVRVDPRLPRDGSHDGRKRVWVTFDINEWYRGWGADPASVWFDVSNPEGIEVGTRALVSGEARWGGEPHEDPIAWPCGFTRYWNEETAAKWESTFATTAESVER